MNRTKIEWVRNPDGSPGYTFNPITGCLNHVNGLCKGGGFPCYAYKLAHGRLKERYLENRNTVMKFSDRYAPFEGKVTEPFHPRFWPERLNDPLWGEGKGIFPCDMSDLFGIGIPESWTASVLDVIKRSPHRFYLLTKQPQNLPKWFPARGEGGHSNCWVGATVTNDSMMEKTCASFDALWSPVRFISFEPLLGRLSGRSLEKIRNFVCQWLIIGAQTKPYKPPKIGWVQEIVEAADRASIPVFLKNNLLELVNYKSPETAFAFNKEGYYRQEFPK